MANKRFAHEKVRDKEEERGGGVFLEHSFTVSGSENCMFQHLFRSAAATSEINTAGLLFCVLVHQHRRVKNTRHHSVLRGSRSSRERTITINLGKDSAKMFFFYLFQTAATVEAPRQQRVRTAK